jgi:hypothetical protein
MVGLLALQQPARGTAHFCPEAADHRGLLPDAYLDGGKRANCSAYRVHYCFPTNYLWNVRLGKHATEYGNYYRLTLIAKFRFNWQPEFHIEAHIS